MYVSKHEMAVSKHEMYVSNNETEILTVCEDEKKALRGELLDVPL